MNPPSGSKVTNPAPVRRRKPPGERNRGAADALQTKIAVNVQNLDATRFKEQLRDNIGEIPDATGCDAAFLVLFRSDLATKETVLSSGSVFSACKPDALTGEPLSDWSWLGRRLGNQKVLEITDTDGGPKVAREELQRFSEIGIGSLLIIGISVRGEVAGYLALANERPVENWDANLEAAVENAALAHRWPRVWSECVLSACSPSLSSATNSSA